MNPGFFKNNRREVYEEIKDNILLVHSGVKKKASTKETYPFRPNKMFYYLTGLTGPDMVLVLYTVNEEKQEVLFIPKNDPERERWEGKGLNLNELRNQSAIQTILFHSELNRIVPQLLTRSKNALIWLNEEDNQREEFSTHFNLTIPSQNVRTIHPYLSELRKVKTAKEIENLKETIQLAVAGVTEVIKSAKEQIYEYELEAVLDFTMKSNGLKTGQYQTILASGKNAAILHYVDNDCLIKKEDLILIDIDIERNSYHCDFTRVFPASGTFTKRQKEIYEAVLSVQMKIISLIRPGVTYGQLNELSKELLWVKCKELDLETVHSELSDYYFHNIGHFIGLDTHDVGELTEDTELVSGMVLTIEPGLYIPTEHIGIRIEDMILVTDDGYENLTAGLVKEVSEIETLISKSRG